MRWWPKDDPGYEDWREGGRVDMSGLEEDEDEEVCYGECPSCSQNIHALIRLKDLVPSVIALHGRSGPDGDDWGAGYVGGYYL
jgi:hypothetical protein